MCQPMPGGCIAIEKVEPKAFRARVDWDKCIGCGVCARFCPSSAIAILRREQLNYTPKDSFERCIRNAVETGTLPDYLVDNFDHWTFELLRHFLRILMAMDPVKKMLALEQLQSKYLRALSHGPLYEHFARLYHEGRSD